jgi:hypothetical protein
MRRHIVQTTQPRNRLVRRALDEVRAAGFTPTLFEGRCYRVAWLSDDGRERVVAISRSPANGSGERLVLATVRRALRASAPANVS